MIFGSKQGQDGPSEVEIGHAGKTIRIKVRRSERVKRLRLSIEQGGPVLTLSPRISLQTGIRFADRHASWIVKKTNALGKFVSPLVDEGKITVIGIPLTIKHAPEKKGGVFKEGDALYVTGDKAHLRRRVSDYAKEELRKYISRKMKYPFSLKDTKTRWGSCSSKGHLNFSYKLVFAPKEVIDYLLIHEQAHVRHMNHGPKFWKEVAEKMPDYKAAEKWLKEKGNTLHLY